MKRARLLSLGFIFATIGVTASCSDSATGIADVPAASAPAAPQASLLGTLLQTTGLLSCSPLPYDSVSRTIGPDGGWLQAGPHSLYVPAGALDHDVTITAVVPSARVNVIRFQPEGLQFDRSAALTMSYANCNLLGKLLPKRIAYTTDDLRILSYLLSLDLLSLRKVTGKLDHFSSYAVAW